MRREAIEHCLRPAYVVVRAGVAHNEDLCDKKEHSARGQNDRRRFMFTPWDSSCGDFILSVKEARASCRGDKTYVLTRIAKHDNFR